jgi:hypothetical protein
MNSTIQFKTTTRALLIALVLLCPAAAGPKVQAVVPPPDGGYPGFNTAEGQNALFSLTTGSANTAVGWYSLFSNAEGSFNTATGAGALLFNTAIQNTAFGAAALLFNTTGGDNTAVGAAALLNNTTGFDNTAIGRAALFFNNTGNNNTANGVSALSNNTTGGDNTAIGWAALLNNTGSFNIALGAGAGSHLTTGDSNIDIGNQGVAGESNTIRIGGNSQNRAFIAGIRGVTTANAAIPVLIDTVGQLGTMSSSARFKKEIKPMDKASEAILALKPVTFHYKSDKTGTAQFGLIAEEVAQVNPNLVVRDSDGEIYTVRYEAVNAMLLNEFLKEHRKNEEQEATAAQQQRQIEALTTEVKKMSAQIGMGKVAANIMLNNH